MVDLQLVVAGLVTGFLVGMTGTGGGALMTPILTLLFGVPPLTAISTDLVTGVVMKPVAVAVHIRRHSVRWDIVGWLCLGSVPAAFLGAVLDGVFHSQGSDHWLRLLMGCTLLLAVLSTWIRALLTQRPPRGSGRISGWRLVVVGAVVGLAVGMTSIGSGSLMMVSLLVMYPVLSARDLVGTDLTQALPLVASAALGHLIFGSVDFGMAANLLIGSLPGALCGALVSSRAPDLLVRVALAVVLLASGLSLVGVGATAIVIVVAVAIVVAWGVFRRGARVVAQSRSGGNEGE